MLLVSVASKIHEGAFILFLCIIGMAALIAWSEWLADKIGGECCAAKTIFLVTTAALLCAYAGLSLLVQP